MDDLQVGRVLRAVRLRAGLRQLDVAMRAGVSQQLVSLAEAGQFDHVSLRALRAIGRVLGIRFLIMPRWRGTDLERLLDSAHALIVERVAAHLGRHGWEVIIEYTFSHYGERGSVDLVAWHASRRALLLVEAKSELVNLQELHAAMDRKRRVVPQLLLRERGWRPSALGEILVVEDRQASRSIVTRHAATFDVRLPGRSRAARGWIRAPVGDLAACWFLTVTNGSGGVRKSSGRRRARLPSSRSKAGERGVATPPTPA
jgi:transcriptional regulator with XRE-family HTH domain